MLDLEADGADTANREEGLQLRQRDVAHTERAHRAVVHEVLHRSPHHIHRHGRVGRHASADAKRAHEEVAIDERLVVRLLRAKVAEQEASLRSMQAALLQIAESATSAAAATPSASSLTSQPVLDAPPDTPAAVTHAGIGSVRHVGSCHDHLNVASVEAPAPARSRVNEKCRCARHLGPVSACLARVYHSSAVPGAFGGARTFTAVKNTSRPAPSPAPSPVPSPPTSPAT